jgi:hypothetical protein
MDKDKQIIEKLKELISAILSKDCLILPREAFEDSSDGEKVGLKILAIKQKVETIQSEITSLESQGKEITNADSESALNAYAKKCGEIFTKPSGIAQGWRACYEWIICQGKEPEVKESLRDELIKCLKWLSYKSFPNKTYGEVVDEYLNSKQ